MSRPSLTLIAALWPALATAETATPWVSNTEICPGLRGGASLGDALAEMDALVLGANGYEGIEYHCEFEPALDLAAPDGTITTHMGYCEEPGLITPQLFTFRIERHETPRVTLHDGSDTPFSFFACP